jgi:membrane protein implicated in regulation of membrane protease activity
MIGKLLGWAVIFVAVVMLLSWNEDMWFLAPLAVAVYIAALVVYSRVKADREYMKNPYEGMLIGRVSSGMDHKGRQTRKIIR